MRKLTYRPLALEDLDAIFEITGSDYPERGFDFVQAIRARCQRYLIDNPELGPARTDLGDGIRIYPIKAQRAIIAYRITASEIVIIRVFYGGTDYEAILIDMDDLS